MIHGIGSEARLELEATLGAARSSSASRSRSPPPGARTTESSTVSAWRGEQPAGRLRLGKALDPQTRASGRFELDRPT